METCAGSVEGDSGTRAARRVRFPPTPISKVSTDGPLALRFHHSHHHSLPLDLRGIVGGSSGLGHARGLKLFHAWPREAMVS